jgi:hypothetical protein
MIWSSSNEPRLAIFLTTLDEVVFQVWMFGKSINQNPSYRAFGTFLNELIRILLGIQNPVLELPSLSLNLRWDELDMYGKCG